MSDDPRPTPRPPTAKQQAFIEHYLTCWNATEAARRAGYSEKSAQQIGAENLVKPVIQDAISARLTALQMSADEVLSRLTTHARASIAPFLRVAGNGDLVGFDFSPALPLSVIKKVSLTERTDRNGESSTTVSVELHDAQAALALLGKHHRLFVDRTEVSGEDGKPIQIEDARERLLARLTRRADNDPA